MFLIIGCAGFHDEYTEWREGLFSNKPDTWRRIAALPTHGTDNREIAYNVEEWEVGAPDLTCEYRVRFGDTWINERITPNAATVAIISIDEEGVALTEELTDES